MESVSNLVQVIHREVRKGTEEQAGGTKSKFIPLPASLGTCLGTMLRSEIKRYLRKSSLISSVIHWLFSNILFSTCLCCLQFFSCS